MDLLTILGLGLILGLKHATEVDHVVAVSTIVSQHRNVLRSALVGALWGIGHTASLLVIGLIVLSLRVAIPEQVSTWLEFCVALMIIGLGAVALWRSLRKREHVHVHEHNHDGVSHVHIHFHEPETRHHEGKAHSHAVSAVGIKPVLIGTMHGLAGSGALMLLVLTQTSSALVGFFYLVVFGLGSIVGMVLMSGLIGLPFALTGRNLDRVNRHLQTAAAVLSIAFGVWYAYETALAS
ncbi:MAG TPA: sulfite exporter TauE/SafE family protein [Pyrinomonadaceae bacterium]|nr:sulfite exporter TauE/SafE family protein [Pyrinomonadaceae bacterium]